jgi:hypothetical protein
VRSAPRWNGFAPGGARRRSKPLRRSSAYCDQLMDFPNSPSLGRSMPACLALHDLGDGGEQD